MDATDHHLNSTSQDASRHIQTLSNEQGLHLFQISAFISVCRQLLPVIEDGWRRHKETTTKLPLNVLSYICAYLNMDVEQADKCWILLRPVVTSQHTERYHHLLIPTSLTEESVYRLNTLNLRKLSSTRHHEISTDSSHRNTAAVVLSIEFELCPEPGCGKRLVRKPSLSGTLLTVSHGRLPIHLPSMYCNRKHDPTFASQPTHKRSFRLQNQIL